LLLKEFERLGIATTMFILGNRVKPNSSLLRDCAAAGHVLAVHGYDHHSFLWHGKAWQMNSISRTEGILIESEVPYQKLFRPPYGRFNPATFAALRDLNYAGVLWSRMVNDWIVQDVVKLEQRLCRNLQDSDIIVLHDGHEATPRMIQALPRLADEVARRGWRFVTLSTPTSPQLTCL
jgi:peptidoglycan/xylan/chitin deacetylase (PgdA/CDA1 family)